MKPTLATARALRLHGIVAIPCKSDKRPALPSWKRWQDDLPADADLAQWFSNGAQLAIVGGEVQCLDLDTKHADRSLVDQFEARCLEFGLERVLKTVVIQDTPSGGRHYVFRCADIIGNQKLARNERDEVLLETRGEGGYFLASPSVGYDVRQGDIKEIPIISVEDRDALLACARTFDRAPARDHETAARLPGAELSPCDDYDARADVPSLLRAHGWKPVGASGRYWTRPGKDHGVSASWDVVPGRFYVFSTSTPFQAEHLYRPYAVFAVLECNGDFKEAARRLRRMGFGSPSPRTYTQPLAEDPPGIEGLGPVEGQPAGAVKSPADRFPPITLAEEEDAEPLVVPPQLIHGLLYQGAKMMLAGPSKARKTYLLTDLAVSVAAGVPWLGYPTTQGAVLYINLELQAFAFRQRRVKIQAQKVTEAQGLPLYTWHLRGFTPRFADLRARLLTFCAEAKIGLIIIDPIYKLDQGASDENAARDVGVQLNQFEALTRETGAALAFAHHFAKGNAAHKDSIDRASGSGVFARDPDALLTLTPHEQDDAMVVEAHLRNFPPTPAFAIRWQDVVWTRALDLDPEALRQPNKGRSQSDGRDRRAEEKEAELANFRKVLGLFGGRLTRQNVAQVAEEFGCTDRTAWRHWKRLRGDTATTP